MLDTKQRQSIISSDDGLSPSRHQAITCTSVRNCRLYYQEETSAKFKSKLIQGKHFCEARRASHCHSPQTTFSSNSTCCVLSTQKSAMHVVVYADRLTTQHSIVDIVHWSWSYWQFWYPRWHVECFWPALAAHRISSASHTSVLPQHPRRKIVPYRVGWNPGLKPSHKRLSRVNVSSHRHMT